MESRTIMGLAVAFVVLLLGTGVIIYQAIEGWSWIDSFYFTGVTITTGHSGLEPTHDTTKIFTVFLGMASVLMFIFIFGNLVAYYLGFLKESRPKRAAKPIKRRKGGK